MTADPVQNASALFPSGASSEEEAAAARAHRRAETATGQRPPSRLRGQRWHH